ncbi:hypothetical protein N0V83_001670 [Neocucurbitaria cava]|uniref:Peptidase S8/S53 domain-containing protein n=1 Tax=Neocucurbitaria cava TaxID=798079 RepID=A0A9W9CQL9_9PLEO|nr:hypothetical protein N0V83_001670 [Neocucurbitaria cava]
MQIHTHPAILALGIIFLEIITGTRFKRTREDTPWEQCNKDNSQALQLLNQLEKKDRHNREKRISSGMNRAIRACLKLEPPPNFPSNRLSEEGPIRHYILQCIVRPLAIELQEGYKVQLDALHKALIPGHEGDDPDGLDDVKSFSRRSTASIKENDHNDRKDISHSSVKTQVKFKTDIATSSTERREACSYRNREELVDEHKVKAATTWFEWHDDASSRITEIRDSTKSNARRVKIAILDSGIELSQDTKDMYDFEPKIQYRSWVDEDETWKDEVGHGTHLAILLRKIAPNAMIHVERVFKKKPTTSSTNKIADAIRAAVEAGVDIIVMSFGFGEEHKDLYDAIQEAAYKNVLVFAAASNDGKNRPDGVAWPAKDNNVICVHSGDGNGARSTFTPSPSDNMRIMVLGECVKSACPPHLKCAADHKLMSGTSCAAPIAAGIAALILDYARGFLDEHEWNRLRRTTAMLRMFKRMKDEHSTDGYWWIKHWQWFDSSRTVGWIQGEIRGVL